MIGKKVPLYCHEYFYSRTGVFSKDYIPKDFYTMELLQKANVYPFRAAYDDKNIYDVIFAGENVVHTILKNMNGYYYFEGKPVSEEEAVHLCQNMNEVILKPAMDKHGNGVKLLTVTNGVTNVNGMSIGELFKQYKRNFLIQERVKQHKDIAALNPTSVNTMRILTYRSGMSPGFSLCCARSLSSLPLSSSIESMNFFSVTFFSALSYISKRFCAETPEEKARNGFLRWDP